MKTNTPKAADIQVGSNIRRLRTHKSMSQEKLGEAVGVTFQQIQKYEKGTNRVGGSRLVQIAGALGVSVETLFSGINAADVSPEIQMPTLTRDAMAVADDFDAIIDPNVRLSIRALVKSLSRHQVANAA